VDLDYKGLANAGTWFIGRLQTERDKARVLDGLEGAASNAGAGFNRSEMEKMLSKLGSRVFLMNNVHEDHPVVFETRWTMSYLRGPLTRPQIKQLMDARRPAAAAATAAAAASPPSPMPAAASVAASSARPVLPPQINQFFIPIRSQQPAGATLAYKPAVLGSADIYFSDTKSGQSAQQQQCMFTRIADGPVSVDWNTAQTVDLSESDLEKDPGSGATFANLPSAGSQPKNYDAWSKQLADAFFRTAKVELLKSDALGMLSKPGESERDFKARLGLASREQRDSAVAALRQKYASKLNTIQERIRKADLAKEVQQQQASASKWQTAISVGSTVLGALFGRKTLSATNISKAATAAKGVSRSMKESGDVTRADENVQAYQQQLDDLNSQIETEVNETTTKLDTTNETLEKIPLRPKKTDIKVRMIALAWVPYWQSGGTETLAWQ
jgi:hypothetical protein